MNAVGAASHRWRVAETNIVDHVRSLRTADILAFLTIGAVALAAQASILIAFGVMLMAVCAVLFSFSNSKPLLWTVALLLVVPAQFMPSLGKLGADATYKAVIILILIILLMRERLHRIPAVTILIAIYLTMCVLSLVGLTAGNLNSVVLMKATFGYSYYWLGALIAWRLTSAIAVLEVIRVTPALSVVVGVLLEPLLGRGIIRAEYTGLIRLGGSLIPAHLAMLSLVGIVASAVIIMVKPEKRGSTLWLGLNILILLATLTRGATVAAVVFLVFAGLAAGPRTAGRKARNGIGLALLVACGGVAALIPSFLSRSRGNSYEGGFNTSGRSYAWEFYYSLGLRSPWFGNGPGYSSVAVQENAPARVQAIFRAPHNEYLHFFVDFGLPATVAVVFCVVAIWRGVHRQLAQRSLRICWLGFGIAFAIYATVDNPLSTPQFSVPMALMVSAMTSLGQVRADTIRGTAASEGLVVCP